MLEAFEVFAEIQAAYDGEYAMAFVTYNSDVKLYAVVEEFLALWNEALQLNGGKPLDRPTRSDLRDVIMGRYRHRLATNYYANYAKRLHR